MSHEDDGQSLLDESPRLPEERHLVSMSPKGGVGVRSRCEALLAEVASRWLTERLVGVQTSSRSINGLSNWQERPQTMDRSRPEENRRRQQTGVATRSPSISKRHARQVIN